LFEYLWLLRTVCERLGKNGIGSRAMLYLAAAVSDFYIPKDQVLGPGVNPTTSRYNASVVKNYNATKSIAC
jgi:hypothetical protein